MFRRSYLVVTLLILMNHAALAQNTCESKINSIYTTYVENRSNDLNRRMDVACRSVFGMWSNTCDEYLHTPAYEIATLEAQKKTYSLEQFKTELEWAGNLIKPTELKIKKWGKMPNGNAKTLLQNKLQGELLAYFKNPRFFNAYILNDLLDSAGLDCKKLQKNGFSCTQKISVPSYQTYLQKILDNLSHDETEQIAFQQLLDFRSVARFVDFIPLYEASNLKVKQATPEDQNLSITIPVKCQSGFDRDEDFEMFFQRMKRVVENFWKGDYQTPSGDKIHITTHLVMSDSPEATSVRVMSGQDDIAALYGSEGGFSVALNAVVFKPNTINMDKPSENFVIAHEFGHALGFDDQYYLANVDPTTCDISYMAKPHEIMGSKNNIDVHPEISADQLKFLYNTYNTALGYQQRYIFKNFIDRAAAIQKERGIDPLDMN